MARKTRPGRRTDDSLRAPLPEQMLSDVIHEISGERILCGSIGRAQFADAAAASLPAAAVTCHFLDIFPSEAARHAVAARRIRFLCTPDFPDEEFDVFGLPVKARGEAELTRDLIQAGYLRLVEGGRFLAV